MTKRGKVLLIVGLLLASLVALAVYFGVGRTQDKPSGNARFVAVKEEKMQERTHVEMPLSSVQGNGGTHRPEREIRYRPGTVHGMRGRA
ncbi:MAG: hypothetical protein Q4E65_02175 [Clostridia bacterium]|nr:hypothetical protein [Clostridia bacterium]